jgi:hypothetical protein
MVSRVTGSQDNVLGVCFSDENSKEIEIEVIEWEEVETIRTSREEALMVSFTDV